MLGIRNILILIIIAALTGAVWKVYNNIKQVGRNEVTTQIQDQNQKLDENVRQVNENITRRVINETHNIERRSKEVEEVINAQPSEALSNVTRARLERVRDQQQAVRETNSKTE